MLLLRVFDKKKTNGNSLVLLPDAMFRPACPLGKASMQQITVLSYCMPYLLCDKLETVNF